MEILGWLMVNKLVLIEGYLALIGLASVIVKLTPTLKDDAFLKKILRFSGKFIALNRK